jgi:hypothetical protein
VRRLGTMLSAGIGITEHQAKAAVRSAGGMTRSPSSTPSRTTPSKASLWSVSPPPLRRVPAARRSRRSGTHAGAGAGASGRHGRCPVRRQHADPGRAAGSRRWPPRRCPGPRLRRPGDLGPMRRHDLRAQGVQRRDISRGGPPGSRPRHRRGTDDPAVRYRGHGEVVWGTAPGRTRRVRGDGPRRGPGAHRRAPARGLGGRRNGLGPLR